MSWWHKPDPPDMEGYVPDVFYEPPDADSYRRWCIWKSFHRGASLTDEEAHCIGHTQESLERIRQKQRDFLQAEYERIAAEKAARSLRSRVRRLARAARGWLRSERNDTPEA